MDEEERIVEGEVVRPGAPDAKAPVEPPKRSFFQPMSGAVILGVDWLAFGADFFSGFVALAVVAVAAFAITFWSVEKIQLQAGDAPRQARLKALIGATAAGVPFPITGTIVGAAILALSGLSRSLRR
jgi:hypothetical protein